MPRARPAERSVFQADPFGRDHISFSSGPLFRATAMVGCAGPASGPHCAEDTTRRRGSPSPGPGLPVSPEPDRFPLRGDGRDGLAGDPAAFAGLQGSEATGAEVRPRRSDRPRLHGGPGSAGRQSDPSGVAQALNVPPLRLDGLVAKLQRLLNLDGYEILPGPPAQSGRAGSCDAEEAVRAGVKLELNEWKLCAAERGVESLTQPGGARRDAPGSSD